MWYLLGIGSNIDPGDNLSSALCALADEFHSVWVSRIGVTEPVGVVSDRDFLNCVVMIWTPLAADALKARLNRIETGLGRDRTDPQRAQKDRTIDLDILYQGVTPFRFDRDLAESYYRQIVDATVAPGSVPGFREARVEVAGVCLGQAPATVYRNGGTGHEVVVDQRQ